jgi:membrane protease subunit HflC
MTRTQSILLALIVGILFVTAQAAFIVRETEQAMVIQFGDPVARYETPGLKFKIPVIQTARFFDKRVLDVDTVPEEVILADQKRIVVDTFARYRITDMLEFYRALSTEQQANTRLSNIINSTMRSKLGNATLAELLSDKRAGLMADIKKQVNTAVDRMGIEIVDVRIGRADLPEQTSQSIYARMRTEREREAADFRAQGSEQAQMIKSLADKERTILLAEAEKQAQASRGQGDEAAINIYAEAFKRDPEFYSFYRTMQAYRESLPGDNTTLILDQGGDFFKFFKNESGTKK